ncbi:helix-turn-helix domain-containing protein [Glutamicibacter protophormiae]|uniref:helix-turn-helix domain-containing protein n=1 Tax=Glutamicibacter protophormiae TaxID=37930 RepID=UPI003A9348D0
MGFGFLDPRELSAQQRQDLEVHRRQHEARTQKSSKENSLAQLRELAGLSTKELAGRLKTSADRVQKLESGDLDRIQLATLRRHAEAIGCHLELRYVAEGAHAAFS